MTGKRKPPLKRVIVEYVMLDKIKPSSYANPNTLTEREFELLVKSIKEDGFDEPIQVNKPTMEIMNGHHRLKAAGILGMKKIPVVWVDMTPEQMRIATLRHGERARGHDDHDVVGKVLREIEKLGAVDMAIDALLLDKVDLAKALERADKMYKDVELDLGTQSVDGSSPLVELAEGDLIEPLKEPTCRVGDLWALGEHRLYCGSCVDAGAVLFPDGARYDLLVTDPPYGVSYANKNAFLNVISPGNRIQTEIEGDHHTPEEMSAFWVEWFTAARAHARPGAAYYVTGPQGGDLLLLLSALRDSGFPLRHMLVWAKNNHVFGRSDYHYKHEPIIYGWVEGAAHHAVENRSETSLWEIPKPQVNDLHPTMKPVELYARAIRNSTDPGQIVYDPFAGSGTCVMACEQLGRQCRMAELTPAYCDIIIARWEKLTSKKAEKL